MIVVQLDMWRYDALMMHLVFSILLLGQLLDVGLELPALLMVLSELLLQLQKLFLLAFSDGKVLIGLLALLKGITLGNASGADGTCVSSSHDACAR